MKQVIGHRGAAGLALENSKSALQQAIAHGASTLEIDVRQSRDHKLVLCHDADLNRMADDPRKVADLDWKELSKLSLRDGSQLLSLEEALSLVGIHPMMVEMKEADTAELLIKVLDKFPDAQVSVASFKKPLLLELRANRPLLPLYVLEHTDALDGIQFARRHKLQGIGLNFWLLSPLSYLQAQRAEVSVYVYTINHRFLGWFIRLLYPNATICTDHPERFN